MLFLSVGMATSTMKICIKLQCLAKVFITPMLTHNSCYKTFILLGFYVLNTEK